MVDNLCGVQIPVQLHSGEAHMGCSQAATFLPSPWYRNLLKGE